MPDNLSKYQVIFYDGHCRLCNGVVKFVLKRDQKQLFKFAKLQGVLAEKCLAAKKDSSSHWESFILMDGEKLYSKSSAALRLYIQLGGIWNIFYLGWIFPGFFRDFIYDFIARNRYKWFGKEESCLMPQKEWMDRFLD